MCASSYKQLFFFEDRISNLISLNNNKQVKRSQNFFIKKKNEPLNLIDALFLTIPMKLISFFQKKKR